MRFGVKQCLHGKKRKDTIAETKNNEFKAVGCTLITTILSQLYKRFPISKRYYTVSDPAIMFGKSTKLLMKQFKCLLNQLMQHKVMSASDCDTVVVEFTTFCALTYPNVIENLTAFMKVNIVQMSFGLELIKVDIQKYCYISRILKLICCLFHGQASGKRVRSDNDIVS